MKALRALMLVLAISVSAQAGWMECGRAEEMPNDKAGDMDNGKTVDPVTETALQLLQSILPLF